MAYKYARTSLHQFSEVFQQRWQQLYSAISERDLCSCNTFLAEHSATKSKAKSKCFRFILLSTLGSRKHSFPLIKQQYCVVCFSFSVINRIMDNSPESRNSQGREKKIHPYVMQQSNNNKKKSRLIHVYITSILRTGYCN